MSGKITVLSWNLEDNGGGAGAKLTLAHEKLVSLGPDLVFRQEMWHADADGSTTMYELEAILGLRGWLGPRSCTALFANPRLFQPVREWPNTGPLWVLPPTALTMHYLPAGHDAMPLCLASYHLNYASPTLRLAEVEWLTTWADKTWTTPEGKIVRIPCLLAGDNNSYPRPGIDGDPALPELEEIQDRPHRLHRSHMGPNGSVVMDTRPDEVLRMAGLEDVGRHRAAAHGEKAALARTVNASHTHGPDARIDRVYATPDVLDAVEAVDIIEVPDLSDHHIVRVVLDGDRLSDRLNRKPTELESLLAL